MLGVFSIPASTTAAGNSWLTKGTLVCFIKSVNQTVWKKTKTHV
jgi:hypothetical protein